MICPAVNCSIRFCFALPFNGYQLNHYQEERMSKKDTITTPFLILSDYKLTTSSEPSIQPQAVSIYKSCEVKEEISLFTSSELNRMVSESSDEERKKEQKQLPSAGLGIPDSRYLKEEHKSVLPIEFQDIEDINYIYPSGRNGIITGGDRQNKWLLVFGSQLHFFSLIENGIVVNKYNENPFTFTDEVVGHYGLEIAPFKVKNVIPVPGSNKFVFSGYSKIKAAKGGEFQLFEYETLYSGYFLRIADIKYSSVHRKYVLTNIEKALKNRMALAIDFLTNRYMILGAGGETIVLDVENKFSEIDSISCISSAISVSKCQQWVALAYEQSNLVYIYGFDLQGKLKPLFFWAAHKEHINTIAFLEDGSLATGGGGDLYCTDHLIHVWNVRKTKHDTSRFVKTKVSLKYSLDCAITKKRVKKLLALPNNQLCSVHSTSFWMDGETDAAILWNLTTRKSEVISAYTKDIHYMDDYYLAIYEGARWYVNFYKLASNLSFLPRQEQIIRYFVEGFRGVLNDYYYTSHVLSSGLIRRNKPLTLEEIEKDRGKFKQPLKAIKIAMTVLSIGITFINFMAGGLTFTGLKIITDVIETAKKDHRLEDFISTLEKNINKIIKIQHWIQNQYSLSPEELLKNFKRAFSSGIEMFILYIAQHLLWRYYTQIINLDEVEAEKLGAAMGERSAEPFMMGLCPWEEGLSLSSQKTLQSVIHWLYSAAHLPFLMKRAQSMPVFPTSEGEEISLPEILCPAGFEVHGATGESIYIEVEPLSRVLPPNLQQHKGGEKEMKVSEPLSKAYCRATQQEIKQLKYQAMKIKSKKEEHDQTTAEGDLVKQSFRLGLFSRTHVLPFVIKKESVDKILSEIKVVPNIIKNDSGKTQGTQVSTLEEKDRIFAALQKKDQNPPRRSSLPFSFAPQEVLRENPVSIYPPSSHI